MFSVVTEGYKVVLCDLDKQWIHPFLLCMNGLGNQTVSIGLEAADDKTCTSCLSSYTVWCMTNTLSVDNPICFHIAEDIIEIQEVAILPTGKDWVENTYCVSAAIMDGVNKLIFSFKGTNEISKQ